ncbi:glycerol-3-phosphate dehydrogenase [Mactra antiquata]
MELNRVKLPKIIEQKVRTWYRLHNKKKNGFMTKSDFVEMTQQFIEEYDLSTPVAEKVRSWLVHGWSSMIEFIKTSEDNGNALDTVPTVLKVAKILSSEGKVTEDMYVHAYIESMQLQPSPFPTCFRQMVSLFFNVFDTDKDGYLTVDDLIRGLRCFGITNTEAVRAVFNDIDVNNTGKIDMECYISAWVEFMTGTDANAAMAKHFTPAIL